MADVELRLVAQTDEYTSGIRQAQQANQSLYSQAAEGAKREKRNIEDIRRSMDQLRQARKTAAPGKEQEMYNKKLREAGVHMKEAKGNLSRYNEELKKGEQVTQKSTKSTGLLQSGMVRLMGAVGGVYGAYRILISVMTSTDSLADRMQATKAGLTGAMGALNQSIAQGDWANLTANMRDAYQAARDYEYGVIDLSHVERAYAIQSIELMNELNEQRNLMNQQETMTLDERQEALDEYNRLSQKMLDNETDAADKLIELERNKLKDRLRLQDEDVDLLERYIREYDKLTENELAIMREAQVHESDVGKKKRASFWQTISAAMQARTTASVMHGQEIQESQEASREAERKRDAVIAAMDDETKAFWELRKEIDRFEGDEAERMAEAIKRIEQAKAKKTQLDRIAVRFDERMIREREAEEKKAEAERLKAREAFLAELKRLEDAAEQDRLSKLEGLELIEAQKQFHLKQIDNLQISLEEQGELEDVHLGMLAQLRASAYNEALQQEEAHYNQSRTTREQERQAKKAEREEYKEEVAQLQHEVNLAELSMLDDGGRARIAYLMNLKQDEINLLMEKGDEISMLRARLLQQEMNELQDEWDAINKSAEIGWKDYVDVFQTAYNEITSVLSSIFNEQVNHWQRERGLLDTRIAETQRAVDQEIEINKQGYASKIALKRQEVEELKEQREQALQEEEEAIQKQRRLDTIMQTTNLITAASNIFGNFAKDPITTGIAIATIATMFGAFAKAKIDAAKATKLAKGGSGNKTGMITGKSHAAGGERFTDNIEVEHGENWGVLAKNKVPKYGKMFHNMVDAMNKDKFSLSGYVPKQPNVVMNNNNDYSRLENEMKGLRKDINGKTDIIHGDGYRIEKRNGITRKIWTK